MLHQGDWMRALIVAATLSIVVIGLTPTVSAQDLPTGTGVEDNCVVVYDFPDAGYAVCKGNGDCKVYERRTTFIGTEERCLV